MSFKLQPAGVADEIKAFLKLVPRGAKIYWVTFTLNPTQDILERLRARDFDVTVICRHPRARQSVYDSLFTVAAFDRVFTEFAGSISRVYGLRNADYADGEHDYGLLHAKFIVAKYPNEDTYKLLTGSFNFAKGSLEDNCEHCFESNDQLQARDAWKEAERLFHAAVEIERDDCNDGERQQSTQLPPVDGPARVPPRNVTRAKRQPPNVEHYRPEGLRFLTEALDRLLCDWPKDGKVRDWQWGCFEELQRRNRSIDLLYLPVGVGKTFIALRWLFWRIDEAQAAPGLFLTPNAWAATTVARDLAMVEEHARRVAELHRAPPPRIKDFVQVSAPARADELTPIAVVADEVHNWNPKKQVEAPTYTALINRARARNIPILGLSATPCRVDQKKFSVDAFLAEFLGPTRSDEDRHAGFGLAEAIEKRLLTSPRYIPIAVGTSRSLSARRKASRRSSPTTTAPSSGGASTVKPRSDSCGTSWPDQSELAPIWSTRSHGTSGSRRRGGPSSSCPPLKRRGMPSSGT